ncbi:hypothetical protein diail_8150 [Diaporthe ilicicola]|nr:hypothetical protein diail_8150 [Diaporthe ilicicola]
MSEAKLTIGSLPTGYAFVPKGNVYVTGNCRKSTQASGRAVYVVVNGKNQQIGLGVPIEIYSQVQLRERSTRADRAANVVKRDDGIAKAFQKEIVRLFPRIPPDSVQNVLKIALQKGKGKVGRTGTISVPRKARLAVQAHVRHCETDYDALLRRGVAREEARQQVEAKAREVCRAWGPVSTKTQKRLARPNKKTSEPKPTKPVKPSSTTHPKKDRQASKSKTAVAPVAPPKATKTPTKATSKGELVRRAAMRAQRRQHRMTKSATNETKSAEPTRSAPKTPRPKTVLTAASFREKRTPKPKAVQPAAQPPTPTKVEYRPHDPRMAKLDPEQRNKIRSLLDQITRAGPWGADAKKNRRHSSVVAGIRIRQQELHSQINEILVGAGIEPIESSVQARWDLGMRMSTQRIMMARPAWWSQVQQ